MKPGELFAKIFWALIGCLCLLLFSAPFWLNGSFSGPAGYWLLFLSYLFVGAVGLFVYKFVVQSFPSQAAKISVGLLIWVLVVPVSGFGVFFGLAECLTHFGLLHLGLKWK